MAAKGEVNNELRQGEVNETNEASAGSDSVDALVSSFLAELTDISSEMKPVRQPSVEEATPAVGETPSDEKQAKLPPPFNADKEEALSEPKLDLEGINNEVEKSLAELENLKAKVIPIADRKEFKAEPQSLFASSPKKSAAAPATRQSSDPVEFTSRSPEERDWSHLDIFRATVSTDGSRRRRKIFFILTAAVLLLILGYFYFFGFNRITPAPDSNGQIPESESKQSSSVAAVSQRGFKPASINASDIAGTCFNSYQLAGIAFLTTAIVWNDV